MKTRSISFENIFDSLDEFVSSTEVNFKEYSFIEPIGIAILKSLILDNDVKFIPPSDENAKNYISTMLNKEYNPANTYIPIERIKSYEKEQAKEKIVEKILKVDDFQKLNKNDTSDLKEYITYMIGELLDNAISHSKSPIGAIIGGQYFKTQKKLQIVVLDRGIGFFQNIKRKYDVKSETEAIEKALEKGVSSSLDETYKSGITHMGYGLFVLREIIKYTEGNLIVISNNGGIKYNKNNSRTYENISTKWKGSIVAFEFYEKNINHNLSEFFNIYINQGNTSCYDDFFS